MELKDLPDVVIDNVGGYKYILVEVSYGDDKKFVVRANKDKEWHIDIFNSLKNEAKNLNMYCLGGGFIKVCPEEKTITISGRSGQFGREDKTLTAWILKKTYTNFEIVIK